MDSNNDQQDNDILKRAENYLKDIYLKYQDPKLEKAEVVKELILKDYPQLLSFPESSNPQVLYISICIYSLMIC